MSAVPVASLTGVPVGSLVASVAQPTPSPDPAPDSFEAYEVSPGLVGFLPVFLIALASVLLFLSLTRHLRRVTVRQAAVDARDAETAAGRTPADPAAGPAGPTGPGGPTGSGGTAGPGGPRPGDDGTGRP